MFTLPKYYAPDFSSEPLKSAPDVRWEEAAADGVAPENYHSTSMYPEYFKINGEWMLPERSRMDSSVVFAKDGTLKVIENRNLCLNHNKKIRDCHSRILNEKNSYSF